ncbi:MAG TPA: glycosyl transferase family 2, partial [Burkholderiaceae bacterium]
FDTAHLDALFAQTHAGEVIDIPTGVGFCMYIRRDSLRHIGLFDVETFGKGYGEENDFCRRAMAAGWRNLHALDTFVLHTGGVSFGASKNQRELDAMQTLRRLYPDYEAEVLGFVQQDPARPYRQRIDLARLRARRVPMVLAVAHNRGGGTLHHVEELADHLWNQAAFLLLTPAPNHSVKLQMLGKQEAFELNFDLSEQWEALVAFLHNIGVAHVHYHHLIGHDTRITQLPTLLGVSYDFTAHDYYSFCPQITLTDHSNAYCGEEGLGQCHDCLRHAPAPGGASIEAWRAKHASFVAGARHVFAPSRDTARRFVGFAPTADIRLAPHTDIEAPHILPRPQPRPLATDAPLKIAVIGAISIIKGADLLEDVATAAAKSGAPVEFHLIGFAYRSLRTQPQAALTVHGEYRNQDLPGLLEGLQPDLVWFPAQWPETYSYTLSACLQAGLPVVAPDLGAFAERLAQRAWTWLRPWHEQPAQWLDFFLDIRTAHFITSTPPVPPEGLAATPADAAIRPWHYTNAYAQGLSI